MTIYVDLENKIRAVGSTTDETLTEIEVTDGTFDDWSEAKICCYQVEVVDGHVIMYTPYVDSRLISMVDMLGKSNEELKKQEQATSEAFDSILEELIPTLMEKVSTVSETVDSIIEDVIPSLGE